MIRDYKAADGIELLAQQGEVGPETEKWCAEAKGFSVVLDGKLVCCAGIIKQREGVGLAWALYPSDIGTYHIDPRITRDKLNELIEENGYWRVEATVRCDFPVGADYLRWMGFEREGRMKKHEPDKTDSYLYSIVR